MQYEIIKKDKNEKTNPKFNSEQGNESTEGSNQQEKEERRNAI
jgi:hypothetical protein